MWISRRDEPICGARVRVRLVALTALLGKRIQEGDRKDSEPGVRCQDRGHARQE